MMSRYRDRPIKRELRTALFLDVDRQEVLGGAGSAGFLRCPYCKKTLGVISGVISNQ
jgi:hypothetical protein